VFNTPNPSLPQLQVVCILTACSIVHSRSASISPSILTDFYLIYAMLWYMRWSRQLLPKSWHPQTYRLHLKRHPNYSGGVWLSLRILFYHLFLGLNLKRCLFVFINFRELNYQEAVLFDCLCLFGFDFLREYYFTRKCPPV